MSAPSRRRINHRVITDHDDDEDGGDNRTATSNIAPNRRRLRRPAPAPSASASRASQFAPTPRFIFSSSAQHSQYHQTKPSSGSGWQSQVGPRRTDDIDDFTSTNEDNDYDETNDAVGQLHQAGQTQPHGSRARGLRDSISESSDEQGYASDGMLLDSIEQETFGASERETLPGGAIRQKRRHSSSSPPHHQARETINISSSPQAQSPPGHDSDDDKTQADRALSDSSLDMPAPKKRSSHQKRQSRGTIEKDATRPAAVRPRETSPTEPLPPPATPARSSKQPRFLFDTPLRTPASTNQSSGSQVPVFQSLDAGLASTPAPARQSRAPRFTLPSSQARLGTAGELQEQAAAIPLPEMFSPHKRGARFVPGGLAERMRDLVLEAGGQMHVATTRQIQVNKAWPVGANGALLAECKEVDDAGAAAKVILLVGADAHVATAVKQDSLIGVRHGWYLPSTVLVGMGMAEDGNDEKLEVCWGPL